MEIKNDKAIIDENRISTSGNSSSKLKALIKKKFINLKEK